MPQSAKDILRHCQPLHQRLYAHPLYAMLNQESTLIAFMNFHAFAVWDFMNLLTSLQQTLTCTTLPWKPSRHPKATQLINEIKLEEESDTINGRISSHFMFYLSILKNNLQAPLHCFIEDLHQGISYQNLICKDYLPKEVQVFLQQTHGYICSHPLKVLASFTYARETLISDMFSQIKPILSSSVFVKSFFDYLNRHIELDGQRHQFLALDLVDTLCKTKEDYALVEQSAINAIQTRIDYWDFIYTKLKN